MKPILCSYFLLLIALVLSGCSPSGSVIMPTQTATQLPPPTFTQPMPAPILTITATSTMSTPPPTLEPEQTKETISKLLRGPMDCEAPCFWGIMPGETTLDAAENTFTYLGLQSKNTTYAGKDFYGIEYDFDSGLSITVTLTVQDEIVRNLRADILPEIQKAGVSREWLAYSPETLVTRYGPPTRVHFSLDWGPRSFFDMVMYFDVVDLIVEYTGYDIIPRQKGSPQVCPLTAQFDSVRLWMGKDPVYPPAESIPLEKATSMTIEEFSKLMTGEPTNACFKVNGEVFP